jgi:hypothetical protein
MKLKDLAAKPQLVKITLDTPEVVEQYGDALEFYIWDRQPIEKFIRIATTMNSDYTTAVGMMNDLILDEAGEPICSDGAMLPGSIMSLAIQRVVEYLGK